MLVIQVFKVLVEPCAQETGVEGGEAGQDPREELFEGERKGWVKGVEGCGGGGVGGVEADADDADVFGGGVVGVYEDTADFDEGFPRGIGGVGGDFVGGWLGHLDLNCQGRKVELTDVIWPFQPHRHVLVAAIVGLDPLDYGEGGEVLQEYDGRLRHEGHGVADYGREHQGARGGYPDVRAATAPSDLDSRCCCESGWKAPQYLGVPARVSFAGLGFCEGKYFSRSVLVLVTTSPYRRLLPNVPSVSRD